MQIACTQDRFNPAIVNSVHVSSNKFLVTSFDFFPIDIIVRRTMRVIVSTSIIQLHIG